MNDNHIKEGRVVYEKPVVADLGQAKLTYGLCAEGLFAGATECMSGGSAGSMCSTGTNPHIAG